MWWKVTEAQIEDVIEGRYLHVKYEANEKAANHWTESIMDVLLLNKRMVIWCSTRSYMESCPHSIHFLFLKRHTPDVLHMSRMIPNTSTTSTIMKLLYYISHLCALDTEPHPELDSEVNELYLRNAPTTVDKAPKIPDPNYVRPERTILPTVNFSGTPRRSPRFQDSSLQ